MNLSIRHWLTERQIEISHINSFASGQLAGIAYRIVQDMELKSLMPLDICTLAEVLQLPLGTVEQEISVIALLTENLLRSLSQKKALKRNEGTWLTFQIAYLLALEQILLQEEHLHRPWLNRARIPSQTQIIIFAPQLQGLLKTLSPGKLSDTQAEQALSSIADSLLVQQMNNATEAWLVANGAEELEAKLLAQRLDKALPGYLLKIIAQNPAPLAQLQKFFRLGTLGDVSTIDLYRENYRASLLQTLSTPLLMEYFALKDIYIPLVGIPEEPNGGKPVDLKTWVEKQLTDLETIAVIESEPGYGKTSFCQIWAAEVALKLYPTWMPVVIRLRDIKYGKSLLETLNSGFTFNGDTNLATCLEEAHPRCVLLLDGLDELPPCRQGNRAKAIFLQQLWQFQSQGQHKIVLTGRRTTVEEFTSEIPQLWRRITIQPLEVNQLKQWFHQWALVHSLPIAQNFFTFLKQAGSFTNKSHLPELSNLVRQPLMLHLLGILHRDGLLDDEILQNNTGASLHWEIHSRLRLWLLGYPLTGGMKTMLLRAGTAHIHRTQEAIASLLSDYHPQDYIDKMQAIALKILHSDRHQVTLTDELNTNTLPAFYFRSFVSSHSPRATDKEQLTIQIEFSHPKLGDYLCAEALAAQLQMLTQYQEDVYGTETFIFNHPSSVAQHLYYLLGYGIITQEIEELAIAALQTQQKPTLLQCLESFWRAWCQGRWLDEGIAHKVLPYFHTLQNPVNVEQVNTNVGVNIFLLLATICRDTQISFYPCGNPANVSDFYPETLRLLLAKASVLAKNTLIKRILSQSLSKINLSGAFLSQVMLNGANLEQSDLSDAMLVNANLTNANLTGVNLTGANLTGANLTGVNLETTNLTNACLCDVICTEADREIAKINGALFSVEQFQVVKTLLSKQSSLSVFSSTEKTKIWDRNTLDIGLIESLEGELIMPTLLDNDTYDETVFASKSE
ncbi:pentapeptide repeat-containing protein [Anabaena subtropica]|uniref:Pentapeptide repeat-containing protein n=1 Tax=Anabaena subtropica FACHB-260 TaxID=2692884 RepID=A0ABR8CMP5_9NOST|nr:pentapeptide repeat-containing protein [Anabaena subtropica]MBD2343828.1 pentapeptide repeat-containing protein [Anabaena subtropica FACHB-260]